MRKHVPPESRANIVNYLVTCDLCISTWPFGVATVDFGDVAPYFGRPARRFGRLTGYFGDSTSVVGGRTGVFGVVTLCFGAVTTPVEDAPRVLEIRPAFSGDRLSIFRFRQAVSTCRGRREDSCHQKFVGLSCIILRQRSGKCSFSVNYGQKKQIPCKHAHHCDSSAG